MPDVVGTTSSEATATLRDAGFETNVVAVPVGAAERHRSWRRAPRSGSEAPEGSTVRVNVAQRVEASPLPTTTNQTTTTAPTEPEPEPAVVPDVVGDELADAAACVRRRRPEGVRPVRAVGRAARAGRRPGAAGRHGARAGGHRSGQRLEWAGAGGRHRGAGRGRPTAVRWARHARHVRASRCLQSRSSATSRAKWSRSPWSRSRPLPALRSRAARSCCSTSRRPPDATLDQPLSHADVSGPGPAAVPRGTCRGQDPARPKGRGYFGAGSSL